MNCRFLAAAALLIVSPALPGCLTLCNKTEVVRSEEARREVTFESPAVAEKFIKVAKLDKAKQVGGTYASVLYLTLYSREEFLAENAKFNDAVAKCDNNHDGVITAKEVEEFGKLD